MKRFLLFSPILVLASCATVPVPSAAEIDARVRAVLDGPSQPAAVEVRIDPDFLGERVTLVRTMFVRPAAHGFSEYRRPNDDSPLGVSLGNGLYLDSQNNLSIRVDRLAGVGPDFRGTTEYWAQKPGAPGTGLQAEFSEDNIDVVAPGAFISKYHIDTGGDKILALGAALLRTDDGFSLSLLSPVALSARKTGVRKSWYNGFELSLEGPRTFDLVQTDRRVGDRGKVFVVENRGDYVRIGFGFGPEAVFRLYRSPLTTVVINEADGGLVVFKTTPEGVEWQQVKPGMPVGAFKPEGRLTRAGL